MINETRIYFRISTAHFQCGYSPSAAFPSYFICRYLPETKGISLEKMSVVLGKRRKKLQPIRKPNVILIKFRRQCR